MKSQSQIEIEISPQYENDEKLRYLFQSTYKVIGRILLAHF